MGPADGDPDNDVPGDEEDDDDDDDVPPFEGLGQSRSGTVPGIACGRTRWDTIGDTKSPMLVDIYVSSLSIVNGATSELLLNPLIVDSRSH
ncbi:hypothetical protein SeLEV6574_g03995 [Synchytrium endobioticum]|nr:hypothetical protein SeLEV6574_g03995 [Synchytrium endobioticum]